MGRRSTWSATHRTPLAPFSSFIGKILGVATDTTIVTEFAGQRIVRKVVNISSTSGVNGNAGQSNYAAGKAGIVGLTKTLAKEFGRYDVTVNAVAFGYIQTRLTKPLTQGESGEIEVQGRKVKIGVQGGRIAAMNQMIPLGRGGLPEEAAGSVYLFCSPDSDYVSGQCLVVNGGL